MFNLYDITWGLLIGLGAPVWLAVPRMRRKVLGALRERMGPAGVSRDLSRPAVMIHAVSLGEMNATREMVAQLGRERAGVDFIITTTTDTGYARGQELYASNPRVTLVRYPLDFTRAIQRLLDGLRPSVVVLMELEVWPNFVWQCERRKMPVLLVNGRLTSSSFAGYRRGGAIVRKMFRRLSVVCAQDPLYAERFIALGAVKERVRVTGTMKFDNAQIADRIEGDAAVAEEVGLRPGQEPIWVCGSTGPGEEQIVLRAYRALLDHHPALRLVIVPRHPQRFDEAAQLIHSAGFDVLRRSQSKMDLTSQVSEPPQCAIQEPKSKIHPAVVLGDTMGELRKFYSMASIVLVGRSLIDLGPRQHGSDMIEPAALAKPVVIGPWTHNFAEPMNRLQEAQAVRVVQDEQSLLQAMHDLLRDPESALAMGRRAQQVVAAEQGTTARHVEAILRYLPAARPDKLD